MPEAFYRARDGHFIATPLTAGPWDEGVQHGGPPAALLARCVNKVPNGEHRRIARFTCDILHPIPVGPTFVSASMTRGGRSVDLVDATLSDEEGKALMLARAWRFTDEVVEFGGDVDSSRTSALSGPDDGIAKPFFPVPHPVGYHTATEWRFVTGGWLEPGPASAWTRMTVPLLTSEEPTAVERVLVAADSGSGVAASLDPLEYTFMNVDLTLHLHREPRGEWLNLAATTQLSPTRRAFARSVIADEHGQIGTATQTLLVTRRA